MKDKTAFDWTTGGGRASEPQDEETDKVAEVWKAKPAAETRSASNAPGSADPFSSSLANDPRDQAGAFVAARVTERENEVKDDVFAAAQGKPAVFAEHSTSQAFAVSGGLKSTDRPAEHPFVHRESVTALPARVESPPPPKENPFATRSAAELAAAKEREVAKWVEPELPKENPFATRPEPEVPARENPFARRAEPEPALKENPFATRPEPEPEPPTKKHLFGSRRGK